jgi:hypothetical protein
MRGMISLAISPVMMFAGYLIVTNVLPSLELIVFVSLLYCILPLLGAIGVGFGAAGLFLKNRGKLLPVLGIILNAGSFLPIVFFWVLGLMVGLPFSCLENMANCY